MQNAIVSDIDGTIFNRATPNTGLVDTLNTYGGSVILLTGRPEAMRTSTESILKSAGVKYSSLIMAPKAMPKDKEYVHRFKKIILSKLLSSYNIIAFMDNDKGNIKVAEQLGIKSIRPRANKLKQIILSNTAKSLWGGAFLANPDPNESIDDKQPT